MFVSSQFTYDGKSSDEFNLMLIRTDSGLISGQFGVRRSTRKEKDAKNPIPYFYGVSEDVLTFDIQLALTKTWSKDDRIKIAKWLFQNEYRPFISNDTPDIIYYCMPVEAPEKFFNGIMEGYVNLSFECDSPYGWTPQTTQSFNLATNDTTQIITLNNSSNILKYYYPELEITLLQGTGFKLKNLSNNNEEFEFSNLNVGEVIYINNQKKQIISSTNLYRFDNFNKKWFKLIYGQNRIEVTGKVKIDVRSQFPIVI